jgi:hypothetical protein
MCARESPATLAIMLAAADTDSLSRWSPRLEGGYAQPPVPTCLQCVFGDGGVGEGDEARPSPPRL